MSAASPPASARRPLVHLHIPKTGGLSLRALLAGRFEPDEVVDVPGTEVERNAQLKRAVLSPPALLTGHFEIELVARLFPGAPVVTMLRDPVRRALSAYAHLREMDPAIEPDETFRQHIEHAREHGLADFVAAHPDVAAAHLGNVQTWHLAGDGAYGRYVTELGRGDLERAKGNLQRCAAVGVTERFADSVATLCAALGWEPFAVLPRENRGAFVVGMDALDAPTASLLAEMTALDRELYEFALEELEQRVAGLDKRGRRVAAAGCDPARRSPPHRRSLVVVADVGGGDRHVGNEAMLLANLDRLRALAPQLHVVLVAPMAPGLAARLAVDEVLPPDGDGQGPAGGEALLDAVAAADGLLISGGGNLRSTWPHHLRLRIAAMAAAQRLGKPVVLCGQTLGPDLGGAERRRLGAVLRESRLIGVREVPSAALALALGVPAERVCYQEDDALWLASVPPPATQLPSWIDEPWIAVSLDPSFAAEESRPRLDGLADSLSRIARATSARLAFLPHVSGGAGNGRPGDAAAAAALQASLGSRGLSCELLPAFDARATAWMTQRAAAAVSARYHGLVFATAAAVPCFGIFSDEYTRIKLQGALAHFGLAEWLLSAAAAGHGQLWPRFRELWARRREVADQMTARRAELVGAAERRWARIAAHLGWREPDAGPPEGLLAAPSSRLAAAALDALERERAAAAEQSSTVEYLEIDRRALRASQRAAGEYAASLRQENARLHQLLADAERYAGSLRAMREDAERYALSLEASQRSLLEEVAQLRQLREEAERYAWSLEAARRWPEVLGVRASEGRDRASTLFGRLRRLLRRSRTAT